MPQLEAARAAGGARASVEAVPRGEGDRATTRCASLQLTGGTAGSQRDSAT